MSSVQAVQQRIRTALILVDIQHDFIDGSLAVPDATSILPEVKTLLAPSTASAWDLIVTTQDFHPAGHISFASSHAGKEPFHEIQVPHPILGEQAMMPQMLWPDHCVQGTRGSELHPSLVDELSHHPSTYDSAHHNVQKGTELNCDGYSGFALNGYVRFTRLVRLLAEHQIERLVIAGLATDYCCKATIVDARKFHFDTIVVRSAMRGVSQEASQQAFHEFEQWGCTVVSDAKQALTLINA